MKWFLIVALSLLLVVVCAVYLRHERRVLVPASPSVTAPVKKLKVAPPLRTKTNLMGPVDISGPLKNRALVHWVLPDYPEWAQQQGVTGVLRMKIRVTPAGRVQSFMEPIQLSGEPRLDEKGVDALKEWVFVEKPNSYGDQWGIVTIRFALLSHPEKQPEASLRGVSLGGKTISESWECVRQWIGDMYVYVCKLRSPVMKPAN